ncbi:MAG: hypothetical protein M3Q05_08280, partial [Bacteroidota bacterium]|nr:hypothetical protein [Bacteroidota bacterium]
NQENQPARIPQLTEHYNVRSIISEPLKDFVQKRSKENLIIFLSAMDEASNKLPREFVDYLKKYGSHIDTLPYRGSYGAVLFNGKIAEAINGSGPVTLNSKNLKDNPVNRKVSFQVFSAGQPFGNNSSIIINNFDYSIKGRGLNIVVFDTQANEVTDIVCYDTHLGDERNSLRAFRK